MNRVLSRRSPLNCHRLLKARIQPSGLHQIHASMVKTGLDTVPFPISKLLASSVLVDFPYAMSIFASITDPNLFMFNTILRGHSISEDPRIKQVFLLFDAVRNQGIAFDQFSFISTLKCCARKRAVGAGMQIHGVAARSGFDRFLNLRNALVSFYGECGMMCCAQRVFDRFPQARDGVSWSALMSGYLHNSQAGMVLGLFREMISGGAFEITPAVLSIALSALNDEFDRGVSESIHGYCMKIGFSLDSKVVSATIKAYGRSGLVDSARKVFYDTPLKDVVTWNCMVDAFAKAGQYVEAMALLHQMKHGRVRPNASTLSALLSACATSADIFMGRKIHEFAETEMAVDIDDVLGTALVDMYSKCGYIDKATEVFEQMKMKDVKSWTAMITGLGAHGQAKAAVRLFHQMVEEGHRPNEVTFLAVLSACNHGGLVVPGQECFKRMVQDYHYSPTAHHYGCLTDLLGRVGMLDEAHELIQSLPVSSDPVAWRALLSACRVHGNVELGELARRRLLELGDEHPTDLILVSRTYAFAGQPRGNVIETEAAYGEEMQKEAGWSCIAVGSHLHK